MIYDFQTFFPNLIQVHGIIYRRTYFWKEFCVWNLGAYFVFFFVGGAYFTDFIVVHGVSTLSFSFHCDSSTKLTVCKRSTVNWSIFKILFHTLSSSEHNLTLTYQDILQN